MSARVGSAGRTDVPPTTWEIPAAAALAWLLTAALLFPAGRGGAAWVFGSGWVWPAGTEALLASVGGLATGHPSAGLTAVQATAVPAAGAVYAVIAVTELLLVAATVVAVRIWWTTMGPGSVRGMASRAEAEAVLGLSELRKARTLLRPDIYRRSSRAVSDTEPGGVDERLRQLSGRYSDNRSGARVPDGPL